MKTINKGSSNALEIQKYLRSGKTLEDLRKELEIKTNVLDNLVLLNYSQTDSPKAHPIVMECRGLVLEKDTWNVISFPFVRFFNYLEVKEITETFDFYKADALEKIDGSMITVFWYKNRWYMTTRGTIEGTGNINMLGMTFRQLFDLTIKQYPNFYENLHKDINYIFELVSPESQVVKPYTERALYLTGARDTADFCELDYTFLSNEAKLLGVRLPKRYPFDDINGLLSLANGLKNLDEGFVCVDYSGPVNGSFQRIKVKSPAYVAISHMKESGGKSIRALMRLVWTGEEGEFISYFPQFVPIIFRLKEAYDNFLPKINADIEDAKNFRSNGSRKEFAMWALCTCCPSIMFLVYDKKVESFKQFLEDSLKEKGEKNTSKFLINLIGLNDVNPDQEFEAPAEQ